MAAPDAEFAALVRSFREHAPPAPELAWTLPPEWGAADLEAPYWREAHASGIFELEMVSSLVSFRRCTSYCSLRHMMAGDGERVAAKAARAEQVPAIQPLRPLALARPAPAVGDCMAGAAPPPRSRSTHGEHAHTHVHVHLGSSAYGGLSRCAHWPTGRAYSALEFDALVERHLVTPQPYVESKPDRAGQRRTRGRLDEAGRSPRQPQAYPGVIWR